MTDEQFELAARECCRLCGHDPDELKHHPACHGVAASSNPWWMEYEEIVRDRFRDRMADRAIAAVFPEPQPTPQKP